MKRALLSGVLAGFSCLLLPCSAVAGPAAPQVLAHLRVHEAPAAFAVLPDDSVLLLDGSGTRLARVRADGEGEAVELRGGGFDPGAARIVDMALTPAGMLLLLDERAGTLWVATPDGEVLRRGGMFLHPTELGQGPGGTISVWDPGVGSVTVFSRELEPLAHLEGAGLGARMAPDGRLPRIEVDRESDALEVVLTAPETGRPGEGIPARSRRLVRLAPEAGRDLLDARVLGSRDDEILLEVLTTGEEEPAVRAAVWSVRVGGEHAGAVRKRDVPYLAGGCVECGSSLRLGADGALLLSSLVDDELSITRLAEGGGR